MRRIVTSVIWIEEVGEKVYVYMSNEGLISVVSILHQ